MSVPHIELPRRLHLWVAAILLLGWSIASCSGGAAGDIAGPPPTGGQVAALAVTPSASSLPVGTVLPLQATAQNASGQPVTGGSIFWSSSDTSIATVSSSGVVTARAVGTAQIAASAGGRSTVAVISVIPVPIASVAVVPGAGTVSIGSSIALAAAAYDAAGGALTGRQVMWASSAPDVDRVDACGTVTGVAAGTARITASSEGKSGTAVVTVALVPVASVSVSPGSLALTVGQAAALAAIATDANGNTLPGRGLAWSSGDSSVATVMGSSGLVTAVKAGTTTITATSEGHSASAQVVVTTPAPGPPPAPAAVASIILAPASAAVTVGGGYALSATLTDTKKNVLTGRTITWSSSAPQIATVNGSGSVVGVAPGTATITAASEGKTATARVTVSAPPPPAPVAVASVTVTPSSATVSAGGSTMLSAATRDAKGGMLYGRSVSWKTSAPSVATVSSSGVVTAVAAGSATITATSEGHSGGAEITVNPPPPIPVATVRVTPTADTLTPGGSVVLAAVAYDASNNALTGRPATWLSSAPQIATVDAASGTVTAVAPGSATITATSEGKSGTAQITVNPPPPAPVASVTVSPDSTTLIVGGTASLSATTRDASGTVLTGRSISWSSSAPGVATVSATGVVTAVAAGVAQITAASEGRSGIATVTVQTPPPEPVATVSVTPASATPTVGDAVALTATTSDASGTVLSGRAVTWASSDASIATVSASGVVTAVAAGSATITAASEGKTGTASITVSAPPPPPPAPVAQVVVDSASVTLPAGGTADLSAVVRDADGNDLTGRSITWSSSDTTIASVTPTGASTAQVSGVSAGTVTITATSEGQHADVAVTVEP